MSDTSSQRTIKDAEDAIRKRFAAEGFKGQRKYDPARVIETSRWWYIPFTWIGCAGFIINKSDLYVNWLGSILPLSVAIWGHDRGIFNDWVDFTFDPATDTKIAAQAALSFKHMRPNDKGRLPSEPIFYLERQIAAAVAEQFPYFKRHIVWQTTETLFRLSQTHGLQFTCSLSKPA